MCEQGVKVDLVLLGEIEWVLVVGYDLQQNFEDIVFIVDLIDDVIFDWVKVLQILVNVGLIDMLSQLGEVLLGYCVWLCVNLGFGYGYSQKINIGGENSKYGIWYSYLLVVLEVMCCYQLQLVGIYMYIGFGVDYGYLEQVCGVMVCQVVDFGQDLQVIFVGGGLLIFYCEGEEVIDIVYYYGLWNCVWEQIVVYLGYLVKLEIESGCFLVVEFGVLVLQVCSVKEMGSCYFVLIDVGFNDLMCLVMYGSYYYIIVLVGDGWDFSVVLQVEIVVVGLLCEFGDVFIQQEGGKVEICLLLVVVSGDYLVFYDIGVYGVLMLFNYNSCLLLLEVLFDGGKVWLICCCQIIQELLVLEFI